MRLKQPHWPERLPLKWVCGVATLGALGRRLPAPGTWGSLAGLLFTLVFLRGAGVVPVLLWAALTSWVAVGLCGEAARRLGREDPGEVVLDEFVAMPLVFLGWQAGPGAIWPEWAVWTLGFALFRLFDIWKPLGIARLQRWPEGWGIVADDVAAGLASCFTLHLLAWLAGWW